MVNFIISFVILLWIHLVPSMRRVEKDEIISYVPLGLKVIDLLKISLISYLMFINVFYILFCLFTLKVAIDVHGYKNVFGEKHFLELNVDILKKLLNKKIF